MSPYYLLCICRRKAGRDLILYRLFFFFYFRYKNI
nr:MAG TPA: hypothetical protein [Caudoviricetes sp.]